MVGIAYQFFFFRVLFVLRRFTIIFVGQEKRLDFIELRYLHVSIGRYLID